MKQGAIILDTLMNYDPKKNAQILPDSWRKVVPETYDRIKENQSKGDFLAVIGRSHPNERKMNDLIRKWATLRPKKLQKSPFSCLFARCTLNRSV